MSLPVDQRKYRARVVESVCVSHAWCMYVLITHQYTSLHYHPCLVPRAFYAMPIFLQLEEEGVHVSALPSLH